VWGYIDTPPCKIHTVYVWRILQGGVCVHRVRHGKRFQQWSGAISPAPRGACALPVRYAHCVSITEKCQFETEKCQFITEKCQFITEKCQFMYGVPHREGCVSASTGEWCLGGTSSSLLQVSYTHDPYPVRQPICIQ
jgi:hypothetical protein